MISDIYEKLRARLDELTTGYPETESKVEIRLLERLFTEEEAELYLQLSPLLQNPKDVAKAIVKKNEEDGLVMQPFNSRKIGGMCSCCGDCCGVLRSLKMQPTPAKMVQSNYFARVDEAECTGCETCLDRCQIEAIDVTDGIAAIDLERCIGCGLCATTCPTEAIELIKKPEDQLYEPPRTGAETYIRIMQERGKI